MIEEWKAIEDFPGYSISNFGRVSSTRRQIYGALLKPNIIWRRNHATVTVLLRRFDGKWITRKVSHLVLLAFIASRPEGGVSRHLDGNGTNNIWTNLKWGTQAENIADAMAHGTSPAPKGERNSHAKLSEIDVRNIRQQLSIGTPRHSLATFFDVSKSAIDFIAQRRSWAHLP